MKTFSGGISSFCTRRVVIGFLLLILPLFYASAQTPFSPTNVYNGWNSTTQVFATVPTATGLTFSQFSRGSGLTAPTPVTSGITSSGWNGPTSEAAAVAANKFFTFSITANAATSFTVTSVFFSLQRSTTGPGDFQLQASINGGAFAAFGSPFNSTANGTFLQTVTPGSPISIPTGGNVVFRLVGWNASMSAGTFRINNNTSISGTYLGAAPTISTTGVTGAPFCVSSTTGAATTVSYSATGAFSGGNVFTAQMSNAAGSFATPVAIGTLTSTALSGNISATIPAGTTPGTAYRIRVVSSTPVATGTDNGSDISILQGVRFSYTTTHISCNGSANGSIVANVIEGAAPLTYLWSTGSSSSSISGLSPGPYSLTVTGSNGCASSGSVVTITQPAVLAASAAAVNVGCNGNTNGAVNLSVSGGTSPYTFAWDNSATTQNISGLGAGPYSVTVTDNRGCTQTASATVTEPTALGASATSTDVGCNGGTDGSATLAVSGGITPYTFAWSNSATTQDLSAIAAGTYSVTITDNNGCTETATVTITEPATGMSASASASDVSCNGGSNGNVALSVSGGAAPYSYVWSNSATTQNLSGIAAGTFSVTITDNNGCTETASATVTEPTALAASATSVNTACNGGSDGSVDLTVNGGTSPYSFVWNNSANTEDLSALPAGTYSVMITDNNGCMETASGTVNEPTAISAAATATDILCNGNTNGAVNLSVSGGTSPYTFVWDNSATTQNISGLGAATYSVTITDNNGCIETTSATVAEPTVISASAVGSDVLCNGGSNGAVALSVSGGTSPYTFAWDNSATTQNISGLGTGTYSVTITDNNGCTQTASASVAEPSAISASAVATDVLCGGTNGSVTLSVSGGMAPYSFVWSNGATTQNISGLAAGTYSVTITDGNGCVQTASGVVGQPASISLSATATPVPCHGGTVGAVNLSVSGGTSPYSYSWSNSATTQNISGLAAGSYSVTVTDTDGCIETTSVSVTEPAAISAPATPAAVLCNGGATGAVNLSVSGGTSPYTFAWSNSATTQNISGLAAGTYSVTITDNQGCTQTASASVTQPALISASAAAANVSCFGGSNGNVNLTVSGGVAPYTFAWSNSATTEDISALAAGSYSVTVTDANGCTRTTSASVTQPTLISASATAANIPCNGGTNGSVNLTVSGGVGPYTFAWSNSATTEDISALAAGSYSVTVTDANGCTRTASASVTQPVAISASTTASNVACNGGNNGSVNLTVSGGVSPYTFAWSNSATTEDISGVPAGTYSVNVTDANGCVRTASVSVTQPVAISASTTAANVLCNGGNTGSVNLTVNGGVSPYTFAWSNSATTEDISGVPAGTYSVNVTDANGCVRTASVSVTQPVAISASTTAANVLCNGGNTGSVNLTVSGGVSPYTFAWSNSATTEDLSGVPAGTYSVNVTDANGCVRTASVSVTQPVAISASTTASNVACNGGNTGSVNLTVGGGVSPYTFAWSNSATTEDISGVPAGTYSVNVTDANGCVRTASVSVTQPVAISASTTAANVLCNGGNTGSVNLTVNGGVSPYTFAWSNSATTEDISGVPAGTYSVNVTDANGCVRTASVSVTQPVAISASTTAANVLCNGGNTGSVNLTVNGGVSPYTFAWSNSATTEDLSGLASGTYSVIVTDANGCTRTASVSVTQPTLISASTTAANVLCNGGTNGSVNLTVNGGVSPYTFAWSNSATTEDLSGVAAGSYSVTVTDANGCTRTASVSVTQPVAISASTTAANVLCNGGTNGSVNLTVNGGVAPYTFAWSNSATTEDISGVPAGTYSVNVTDANGCVRTASVSVTEPALINASPAATNVPCNGGNNGSVILTVNGGVGPYTYAWSNSATTQNLSGLAAGSYSVIVTDANGCTRTASVSVTQPTAISATPAATNIPCNGGTNGSVTLTVNGGTAPYTYAWSNSATTQNIFALVAGSYSVTITDNNGCTQTASVSVTQPAAISASALAANVACNGGASGAINLSANGGVSPYTYAWSNSATTQNLSAIAAGTYSVTITDNNGCTQTATATVTEPTAIAAAATASNVNCNGNTNGAVNLTVNGGTGPYTYSWSNSATTQNLSAIGAGIYSVLIIDNNGCTQTASATVTEPAAIASSATSTGVFCNGGATGTIDLTVSGGTSPYTFAWSNSATAEDISALAAGTYSVTITDNNGCAHIDSVTVAEPAALGVSGASTDVSCNGGSNGDAMLTVIGGTAPYTYAWSNSDTAQNISTLAAGTYSVTITDDNGCTQTTTVTVTEPSALNATIDSIPASCGTCANGSADLTVSGGVGPYTYAWSNSATTEDISSVLPGTYTVIITDNNGCQFTDSIVVDFSTSIVEAAVNTVSVSPNPSNGENVTIRLEHGAGKETVFALYDLTGKEVYRTMLNGANVYVLTLPVAGGTYFYQITQENALLRSEKLVIVK